VRRMSDAFRARTVLLQGLLTCLAAFLIVGCSGDETAQEGTGAETEAPAQPNIVFILADDMRADEFEHMPQTQQLLAEQGLTFENTFVTTSLCCPSRASILRGQYAHNHQVLTNARPEGGFDKFYSMGHEDSTLATWLKSSGYETVLIGKYLNGYPRGSDETHVPPGWDEWYARLLGDDYYDYQLNENGTVVSYGEDEDDYYTDVLARKAQDYVQRAADSPNPFFMYLTPATPHGPFVPAQRHEDTYADAEAPRPPSFDEPDVSDKPEWVRSLPRFGSVDTAEIDEAYRERLQMLLSLDEMVAGILEELETTGKLDNTYIFFTSDNGYHLGEHRIKLGKRTDYEETVRVPLAVRGPGVPAGQDVEQIALNIDLAPTIAELAGASTPSFVDGRSLVPFLSEDSPSTWRTAFLLEHWNGGNGEPRQAPTYAAIRTETYKYVEHDNGEKELYDLSSDPYELESLHETADPALIEDLKSRLEALKTCSGETCRTAEDDAS
jgi:N-acetylglucosamine-6-sulfatase